MSMANSCNSGVVVLFTGESRTKQAFKDETDINQILARYKSTGMLSHINENQGRFLDVSEISDFRSAVQRVQDTQKFFMGLPSDVRAEFQNDPAIFLDFLAEANEKELDRYGLRALVTPQEEPEAPAAAAPTSNPPSEPEAP